MVKWKLVLQVRSNKSLMYITYYNNKKILWLYAKMYIFNRDLLISFYFLEIYS